MNQQQGYISSSPVNTSVFAFDFAFAFTFTFAFAFDGITGTFLPFLFNRTWFLGSWVGLVWFV